jgi:hypothetical protein
VTAQHVTGEPPVRDAIVTEQPFAKRWARRTVAVTEPIVTERIQERHGAMPRPAEESR